MEFFIEMSPPRATAQMKKVRVVNGRPMFYEPPDVKSARNAFYTHLSRNKPTAPLQGAVALKVLWLFPKGKGHKDGEWKTTRPDTDNLEKLLKDCMTAVGFCKDDAQVVWELVEKRWATHPGIYIVVENLEDEDGKGYVC